MVRYNDDELAPGKKDPTPEEIRERCEEVQKTWNDRTRLLRSGMPREEVDRSFRWRVPQIFLADLSLNEEMLSDPSSN